MLFRYQALNEIGKRVSGVIDADSLEAAKGRLRTQKILITQLKEIEGNVKEIILSPKQLLGFTRDLGQLLKAGLPVYESLLTIEEKHRKSAAHSLFLDLCDQIKNGSSLSSSLNKYPKSFDPVYLSMIKAAEQTSSLSVIFHQLAQLISRQQKLKKQVMSALTYPAFLGGFCILVICSLLLFVIPTLRELFEDRELHPLTETVLYLSYLVNEYLGLISASVVALIVGTVWGIRNEKGKMVIESLIFKIPVFKTIILQSALIRFARSMSVLLEGGVSLIDSLKLSQRVMKLLILEKVIERAANKVIEGESLSSMLKTSPLIPSLVTRMLSIAEATGKTAPMLQSIAEIYDEELEKNLSNMTTLLQPIILLILGAVVGLVLLSVLLPLTDVSSFVST